MSFFRVSGDRTPVTRTKVAPTRPVRLDSVVATHPEAAISRHATALPLPMPANNSRPKTRRTTRATRLPISQEAWAADFCLSKPIGKCARSQVDGSLFCALHACTSVNADGSRCPNHVPLPAISRICADGYHTENDRYSQVEDALANRRGVDLIEEQQRVVDRQAQIEFFTTHFSDVTASSNSSEEASKSGNSSHDRERRERREPWAGWEVDKWWVGQWRMHRGVRMKEAQ